MAQGAALGIKAGEGEAAGAAAGLAKAAASGWTPPEPAAIPSMYSALSGKGAARPTEPGWQPPKLLTAPDGPAKIAAAASGDRERGREPESRAPVNLTFSPNITIQGNATEKDVRGALDMALPELERMIRRLMHDRERRAYV